MKEKLKKVLVSVLALSLILTMLSVPWTVNAATPKFIIKLLGNPSLASYDYRYKYPGGEVEIKENGVTTCDRGQGEVDVRLGADIEVILTANSGKTGRLLYDGMCDPGKEPNWEVTREKTPEGLEQTTYKFKAADMNIRENDVFSVTCEFKDADSNVPGGSDAAPTDSISVELWDDLDNRLDYDTYRSTVSSDPHAPAIGAKIEYSYDKTNWYEFPYAGNPNTNTDVSYISNRYVFENYISVIYIRVVDVNKGILNSKKLEGIDDGVSLRSGTVEEGKIYRVTNPGVCDFSYVNREKTVLWSDDAGKYGADGTVNHGTVTIRSAVDAAGQNVLNDKAPYSQSGKEGLVGIQEGATVTIEIKPDYGYQFVSGSLNGIQLQAESEAGVYTFTMPGTDLHLAALFTEMPDKVDVSAKGITSGAIIGGARNITSGNLRLTVTDSDMDEAQKAAMAGSAAAANVEITNWLDIKLDQIINKGNGTDVWTNSITELSGKIKIALSVGKDLDTEKTYVVIREHNGVYERIPAVYDAEKGTITFESDRFSRYALGTTEEYVFLEGADGSTVSGSDGYSMRVDAEYSKFVSVAVDGDVIDAKNYTVKNGSTIITFTKEYISSLSVGNHTVRVNFTDGYAETKLTVTKASDTPTTEAATTEAATTADNTAQNEPKTGDDSNPLIWMMLLVTAFGGMIGCTVYKKHTR